jgi:hypothetical protein
MKKINTYLHNPDVQGGLVMAFIVVTIVTAMILTWGK